jgi:ABC-type nitrate/sulfonate/bicarbonate transport system substrate-binding protein
MVEALDAGELDLAVLLTEGAAAGVAKGAQFEVLSLFTLSPLLWGIHVRPSAGFAALADLAAARFAISRYGSGSQLMSLALAEREGWPPESLRFIVVGTLQGAVAAFRQAEADVFLWEKTMTEPVVEAGDFGRLGEFAAPWPGFVVCATQSVLTARRGDVDTVLQRVGSAARTLAARADAAELIADRYGLAVASAAAWLPTTRWLSGPTDPAPALAAARRMLAAAGAI